MRICLLGIGFLMSMWLPGCGLDDSGDDDKPIRETKENTMALINGVNLMGKWEGECHDSDLIDSSMEIEYRFSGDDVEKIYKLYEDADCDDRLATIRYSGDVKIRRVKGKRDYRDLDIEFKKVRATIRNDTAVDLFSSLNFCGVKEWEKGKVYDLTDESRRKGCPLPDAPATVYDRVKIEGDNLYFGNPGLDFASKKSDRPEDVNKDEPFDKED